MIILKAFIVDKKQQFRPINFNHLPLTNYLQLFFKYFAAVSAKSK
jgi:hypothetical protein